jgi:hypothetical protein
MVSWRCPHCGAPQREAARCWVCQRSTTSCASCRNFRKAVAGRLGYCSLDKRRTPLSGDEERPCWERSAAETYGETGATGGTAEPVAVAGRGLWGAPAPTDTPPDRAARGHGMWTESDSLKDPESARHQNEGSIRSRPWGPVPGHSEPTGRLRGLSRGAGSGKR